MKFHYLLAKILVVACLKVVKAISVDTVTASGSSLIQATQFTSSNNSLDAPHLLGISPDAYKWWLFDAESAELDTSIVIIFFTTSPVAFPLVRGIPSNTSIVVNATIYSGDELGNGAVGLWEGLTDFVVAPDLSTATVTIDLWDQPVPIRGCITFNSIAPAHYPCTKNLGAGADLSVAPHVGWSNAIPAANTNGTFEIAGGETFTVNGIGSRDKNWGDVPFFDAISGWIWGHATFGPWSVVFFNGTTAEGEGFAGAYVSSDGVAIVSSCAAESALVVPALDESGQILNITLTIPLPGELPLQFILVSERMNAEAPGVYSRYLISADGGQQDGLQYVGGQGTLASLTK